MNKRILVVETDRSEWDVLREVFQLRGDEPVWAQTVTEAMDRFGTESFDLVLIEALMPKMSGTELCRKLRFSPRGKDTTIILMGAVLRNLKIAQQARHHYGADDTLVIPFDAAELKAKIDRFLGTEEEEAPEVEEVRCLDDAALRALPLMRALAGLLPMQGTLDETPGYLLIPACAAIGEAGVLTVTSGSAEMVVYFEAGRPVFVASNVREQSLGQILLRRGRITEDVYRDSLNRMVESGRRQGEVLIEMGVLSPHELYEAMVDQARAKLASLCGWKTGTYEFTLDEFRCGDECLLDLDPAAIVRAGVRALTETAGDPVDALAAHRIARVADPPLAVADADPLAARLLALVDGDRTLSGLADESDMDRREFYPQVLSLLATAQIAPLTESAPQAASLTREQLRAMLGGSSRAATPPVIEDGYRAVRAAVRVAEPGRDRLDGYAAPIRAVSLDGLTPEGRLKAEYVLRRAEKAFEELGTESAVPAVRTSTGATERGALLTSEVQFRRGLEELAAGQIEDAVDAFNAAVDLSPTVAEYKAYLGYALYRAGDDDESRIARVRAQFFEARKLNRNLALVPYLQARVAVERGRSDRAVDLLDEALSLRPGDADALRLLYEIESASEDEGDDAGVVDAPPETARFRTLVTAAGRDPYFRGHYRVLALEPDASYADVKRAFFEVSEQLQDVTVLRRIPVELREDADLLLHRLEEAYEILTDPARRGPYDRFLATIEGRDATAANGEGRVAARLLAAGSQALERGDVRTAVAQLAKAASADPQNAAAHALLGAALLRQGDLKEGARDQTLRRARESLGRALMIDREHETANRYLAEALAASGHFRAARRHIRRALAADPANVEALAIHHRIASVGRRAYAAVEMTASPETDTYLGYAYEIELAHEKIMRMNFFEVLGLSIYANEDDVPEAYRDAVAEYDYDDVMDKLDEVTQVKAAQIRRRIDDAYAELRDEETFNNYRRKIRIRMKQKAGKVAARPGKRGKPVSMGRRVVDFLNKPMGGGGK